MTPSSTPGEPDGSKSRGLLLVLLIALLIAGAIFLCWLLGTGPRPPFGLPTATPVKWSVATLIPQVALEQGPVAVPGFYCNSCGSSQCRQSCAASDVAVGAHVRFHWCQLMPAEGVYDVGPVIDFVQQNASQGLRSVIGFSPKTDRNVDFSGIGSCTNASDGSPSWMLHPGSVYEPLQNGDGADAYYHLNYRNAAVQAQFRGLLRALRGQMAALPPDVLASIESIEVDIGHDGELDAARNYNNYPPGNPLGWMDSDMYACIYAGNTWHRGRNEQVCTDATGEVVPASQAYDASEVWRNDVIKPFVDIYGQELSYRTQGVTVGQPMVMLVVGTLVSANERVDPCRGCGDRNVFDYAFDTYGIGIKTSGITPDFGNGQASDALNLEYRNWPNIFKLTWPVRYTAGEHGVDDFTGSHCCDDPKEIYWAVLNALDKHIVQLHLPVAHFAQSTDGGAEARRMFTRYAGRGVDDTPDIWIVFRDTQGTYYPDGQNGGVQGDPPGRDPCCRVLPNYEWFVYQRNPQTNQVVRSNLPNSFKSLSARSNANGALKLDIEDLWPGANQRPLSAGGCAVYAVEVEYLDRGTDRFVVRYANASNAPVEVPIVKQGTGLWTTRSVQLSDALFNDNLPGGADLELASPDSGADVFHRLRVQQTNGCNVTVTQSPAPTRTPVVTPTPTPASFRTVVLQPDGASYDGVTDATLNSWDGGNQNAGSSSTVSLRSFDVWAGVIRFDVSKVPAEAAVQDAVLDLYVVSRSNEVNWTSSAAYPLLRAWDESQITWNRATGSVVWAEPGANGIGSDRSDMLMSEQVLDRVGVWVHFDITDAVRAWARQPSSNFGITLKGGEASGNIAYNFASSEYPEITLRPRLIVRYLLPTATPTATPTRTRTPTRTPTATNTATPSPTPSATPSRTPTSTATRTSTPTPTATRVPSPTPTRTPTASPTVAPSRTPTRTATATPTAAPSVCLPTPIGTVALADRPKGMATDGERVYVALTNTSRLAIIRVADNVLESTAPLGPGGVNAVAVVGDKVFTSNRNAATVSINQTGTGQFLQTLPVGNLPWGVGGSTDRVYVANFADNTVTTINPATNTVLNTTPVAALPAFVAALPNRAYVTHIDGHLSVIGRDGARLADLTPGAGELWGIALNPEAGLVYVADRPGRRILALSTSTNQVVAQITLPGTPYGLAYNPETGNLFAVDANTDRVIVVNTRSNNRVAGALAVGPQDANDGGQGITVAGNKVYVGNWLNQSVTVLDDSVCVTR